MDQFPCSHLHSLSNSPWSSPALAPFPHRMARVFSQALFRKPPIFRPHPRFLNLRGRSSSSEKAQLVEVDLGGAGDAEGGAPGGEVDVFGGVQRLEDAIHGIIVKRSAPAWLPFIPGSSYWVPPRKKMYSLRTVELVDRLANPVTQEEALSLTTRGWPSSTYFVEGLPPKPLPFDEASETSTVKSDDDDD